VTDPIQTSANPTDTRSSCSPIVCFCLGFSSASGCQALSSNAIE